MSKPPVTAKGAQELREQLKEFKTVDRPRISAAIAEARAHGDLSEMLNIMLRVSNKVFLKAV